MSRRLTWAGRLAVVAAAAVLPMLPVLAEAEKTKPSSSLEGLVYDVRSGGRI